MTRTLPPSVSSDEHGFTLVELLVSLLVFGLIAAASALLLATSVDAQARVGERLDRTAQLRRAHALLVADLAQAVARPTRDPGGRQRPAFEGGGAGPLAALVRGGWSNPDALPRPSLQRVEWRVENNALLRLTHAALDGEDAATRLRLVDGVATARARYRSDTGWRELWDATDPLHLPRAVELTLTFADGGSLTQRFMVAG